MARPQGLFNVLQYSSANYQFKVTPPQPFVAVREHGHADHRSPGAQTRTRGRALLSPRTARPAACGRRELNQSCVRLSVLTWSSLMAARASAAAAAASLGPFSRYSSTSRLLKPVIKCLFICLFICSERKTKTGEKLKNSQ